MSAGSAQKLFSRTSPATPKEPATAPTQTHSAIPALRQEGGRPGLGGVAVGMRGADIAPVIGSVAEHGHMMQPRLR